MADSWKCLEGLVLMLPLDIFFLHFFSLFCRSIIYFLFLLKKKIFCVTSLNHCINAPIWFSIKLDFFVCIFLWCHDWGTKVPFYFLPFEHLSTSLFLNACMELKCILPFLIGNITQNETHRPRVGRSAVEKVPHIHIRPKGIFLEKKNKFNYITDYKITGQGAVQHWLTLYDTVYLCSWRFIIGTLCRCVKLHHNFTK